MIIIGAIKPNIQKKFKTFFIELFRGGKSGEYKIKQVLFLSVLRFLAATKIIIQNRREKEFKNSLTTMMRKIISFFLPPLT